MGRVKKTGLRTLLLGVLFATACKSENKLEWKAHVLKSAELGPFTIRYPPGWRDLRESADPALAHLSDRAGPNAHVLVRERDANTDTNIALDWNGPIQNFSAVTCADFAKGMAMASQPVERVDEVKFGEDRGCTWQYKDDDSQVHMWTRFHGDNFLVIACLQPKKGDTDGEKACARVVEGLKIQ